MKQLILVVDDDESILELLGILLNGEGYETHTFNSAQDALNAAIANPPDAAIIDLMMPGMTGIDLIEAMHQASQTQHVPVVLCSAYYSDLRRCTTDNGLENVACLRKPFMIQDLLDELARMLPERAQRASRRKSRGNPSHMATTGTR